MISGNEFNVVLNRERSLYKISVTMHVCMRCKCQHRRKLKLKCPLRIYGNERGSWRVRLTWSWCRSVRLQRAMEVITQPPTQTLRVLPYSQGNKCEPIPPLFTHSFITYTSIHCFHCIIPPSAPSLRWLIPVYLGSDCGVRYECI